MFRPFPLGVVALTSLLSFSAGPVAATPSAPAELADTYVDNCITMSSPL